MSYIFECNEESVWSPALVTGELYKAMADTAATVVKVGSGFVWIAEDMARIEQAQFGVFVHAMVESYESSTSTIWQSLIEPFVAISVALGRRCGVAVQLSDPILVGKVEHLDGSMPWS